MHHYTMVTNTHYMLIEIQSTDYLAATTFKNFNQLKGGNSGSAEVTWINLMYTTVLRIAFFLCSFMKFHTGYPVIAPDGWTHNTEI